MENEPTLPSENIKKKKSPAVPFLKKLLAKDAKKQAAAEKEEADKRAAAKTGNA